MERLTASEGGALNVTRVPSDRMIQRRCEIDFQLEFSRGASYISSCRTQASLHKLVGETLDGFLETYGPERFLSFRSLLARPLAAVLNSAEVLLHDNHLSSPSVRAIAIAQRGAMRMRRMIDDLLVFTHTWLGGTLPVVFSPQDLGRICNDCADEARASHPDARIEVQLAGDLVGRWDGTRVGQLLANLLVNAVQHGSGNIKVQALGRGDQMTVIVSNEGNPIPARALPTLFDPLTWAPAPRSAG